MQRLRRLLICLILTAGAARPASALEVVAGHPEDRLDRRARVLTDRMVAAKAERRDKVGGELAALLRGNEKLLLPICAEELKRVSDFDTRIRIKRILAAASGRCIEKTLAALEKKIDFEFVEQPVEECCMYFSEAVKLEISAEGSSEFDNKTPITLRIKGGTLGLALNWIALLARCSLTVLPDGQLRLSAPNRSPHQMLLKSYRPFGDDVPEEQAAQVEAAVAGLVKRIPREIAPGTWGPGRGVIRRSGGQGLIVLHTKRAHADMARLWKAMGSERDIKANTDRAEMIAACNRHLDGLAAERKEEDMMMRRTAACIAKMRGSEAAEWIVAALRDWDWEMRREALSRLAGYRLPGKEMLIARALHQDEDSRVRRAAVGALLDCRSTRATELLLVAARDKNRQISEAARRALQTGSGPWSVAPLAKAFKSGDAPLRKLSVRILGNMKDASSGRLLNEALALEKPEQRLEVVRVLARVRAPRAAKCLISVLRDRDLGVRQEVAEALTNFREPWAMKLRVEAFAALVAKLGDEKWATRRDASVRLAQAGIPAIPALREAYNKNTDLEIVDRAEHLLRRLDPAFEPERQLRSPNAKTRIQGAKALGYLAKKARRAVPSLIEALQDHDEKVRLAAANALARIKDARAKAALKRLKRDKSSQVRNAAGHALAVIRTRLFAESRHQDPD